MEHKKCFSVPEGDADSNNEADNRIVVKVAARNMLDLVLNSVDG